MEMYLTTSMQRQFVLSLGVLGGKSPRWRDCLDQYGIPVRVLLLAAFRGSNRRSVNALRLRGEHCRCRPQPALDPFHVELSRNLQLAHATNELTEFLSNLLHLTTLTGCRLFRVHCAQELASVSAYLVFQFLEWEVRTLPIDASAKRLAHPLERRVVFAFLDLLEEARILLDTSVPECRI